MALWNLLTVLLAFQVLYTTNCSMIKLANGGYEDIVVAINPAIKEDNRIIQSIQNMVKEATSYLFHATKKRLFIKSVKILIPLNWSPKTNYLKPRTETYDKADVIIASSYLKYGDDPYTLQYGACGEPGKYIHFTPNFLLDNSLISIYGPRGRVFVHELAHLRWGVFDEYNNEKPYYISGKLKVEATRCSLNINGTYRIPTNPCQGSSCPTRACNFDSNTGLYEEGCVFIPEINPFSKESVMYAQALSSVSEFCDASNHNTEAPTLQNRMCNSRSTWEVIMNSTDIKSTAPMADSNIPMPSFSLLQYRDRVITLVLDVSGSMSSNDRIGRLYQAAEVFLIQIIEINSHVGIVQFSSSASVLSPLLQIYSDAQRNKLKSLIPKTAGGGTNICSGVRSGIELNKKYDGSSDGTEIVLLTDGEDGYDTKLCFPDILSSGVIIHAIALGPNAAKELEQFADMTGGLRFSATDKVDANDLIDAFSGIQSGNGDISQQSIQLESTGTTLPSKQCFNGTVVIDSTVGNETFFLVTWQTSVPNINLQDPKGKKYTTAQFISDATSKSSRLQIPGTAERGPWVYSLCNPLTSNQAIGIIVNSKAADENLPPITVNAHMNKDTNNFPNPMVVYASVNQGVLPVTGAKVTAIIESGTGNSETLDLFDNGAGPDIAKNDGVYSRYFTSFKANGRYSLKVRVESKGGKIRLKLPGSKALYIPGYVENGEITMNPLRPEMNDDDLVLNFGDFIRTASGGSFVVSNVPSGVQADIYKPEKITDLEAKIQENTIVLQWTATGDDLDYGNASRYDLRMSTNPKELKDNFGQSTSVDISIITPQPAGASEIFTFTPDNIVIENGTILYFAMVAIDKVNQTSDPSNIAQAALFIPPTVLPPTPNATSPTPNPTTSTTSPTPNPTTKWAHKSEYEGTKPPLKEPLKKVIQIGTFQVLYTTNCSMIKLVNGGYEDIVIAINPAVKEDVAIIESIQADVIIASSYLKYGDEPYTLQYGACGEPGKYIHLTPNFLMDNKLISVYGPRGRVFVHEWAHLRWGVFDEYNNEKPYYISGTLKVEATRCSLNINGTFRIPTNPCQGSSCPTRPCNYNRTTGLYEEGCVFLPEKTQFSKESIMYAQAISSVSEFCDASNHNTEAPTLQNRMCDSRSTWEVIMNSTDIKSTAPKADSNIPVPSFSLLQSRDRVLTLVLDVSGSMSTNDRIGRLYQAAEVFLIQIIEINSHVGIVQFSSSASIRSNLLQIYSDAQRNQLKSLIPKTAGGGTNICSGVLAGIEVNKKFDGSSDGTEIVLLTDGEDNYDTKLCFPNILSSGVIIHAIALGPNAAKELEQIADMTGGLKFSATDKVDANDLIDAFSGIQSGNGIISQQSIQLESNGATLTSKQCFNGTVVIDSTVGNETFFLVTWQTSAPNINLQDPKGKIYTTAQFISDATSKSSRLQIPGTAERGPWVYSLCNPLTSNQAIGIVVNSKAADENLPPITVNAHMNKDTNNFPNPMVVYASVNQGVLPVTGAKVTAIIESGTGNSETIELFDNGAGPDIAKNDGIYSRYFTSFKVNGRYSLKVRVESKGGKIRLKLPGSNALYIPGYIENGEIIMNPLRPKINEDDLELNLGDFIRTASGGSFVVSNVPSGVQPDLYKPEKITDLEAKILENTIVLQWTATGDDLDHGNASRYDLRMSTNPKELKDNFGQSTSVDISIITPQPAGASEIFTFTPDNIVIENGTILYFAMVAIDKVNQTSDLSNIAQAALFIPPTVLPPTPNATSPTPYPTTSTTSPTPNSPTNDNSDGLNIIHLVLIICGSLIIMCIIISITVCVVSCQKKKGKKSDGNPQNNRGRFFDNPDFS
ncbi:uncharacterized protein WCC33_009073 [Rhinophrynus dorsalis]